MIRKAYEEKNLVRIDRTELEAGSLAGYIVAYSETLVMVSLVDHDVRYNGFEIVRIEDITNFESPALQQSFVEEAIHARDLKPPKAPDVDLTSFGTALACLRDQVPLVAVYFELDEPEVCYIGRIESLSHEFLHLYYIDPDAKFDEEPTEYRLSEITRVNFGGGYEEALHLVAAKREGKA